MSDHELIRALAALGQRLDDPPDLVFAVRERLDGLEQPAIRRRPRRWALVALAVGLGLVVGATAFAASESVRDWVLRRGVDVKVVDRPPPTSRGRLADLGAAVSPAFAAGRLGRALPVSKALGPPDQVRVSRTGLVTLVWASGAGRPRAGSISRVSVLLTLVPPPRGVNEPLIGKALFGRGRAEFTRLPDGRAAVWIGNAPHAVRSFDGTTIRFRLAANVVIWTSGELGLRLETTLPEAGALALAGSFATKG
ncbi:MAG: hypothetical protein U0R50_06900 [Gaiellales bacterium]